MNFQKLRFRNIDGIPGLVIAIAQDTNTNEVLMVAYTNKEGIEKTLETGKAHYFSTSRKEIWLKGKSSGHVQKVKEIYIDCDGDAILFKVEQEGGACHTGYKSCFYRKFEEGKFEKVGNKVFDPEEVY